jgi:preprotein translocase subunit YajC
LVAFFLLFYFLGILPQEGKAEESQRRILEAAIGAGNGNGTAFIMQGNGS